MGSSARQTANVLEGVARLVPFDTTRERLVLQGIARLVPFDTTRQLLVLQGIPRIVPFNITREFRQKAGGAQAAGATRARPGFLSEFPRGF